MNHDKLKFSGIAVFVLIMIFLTALTWKPQRTGREEPRVIPRRNAPRPLSHKDIIDKRIALIRDMEKSDSTYQCKIPLDFYGKVVDQNNHPVPSAKVVIQYVPDPNGDKSYELTTSTDGRFSYGGVTGQFLFVKIGAPDGYGDLDSTCRADYNYAVPGEFNFHVPDPNEPVIFKVWKYVNPEPMNNWLLTRRDIVANDGTTYWFDMKSGKVGGNDLGASVMDDEFSKSGNDWCGLKITAGPGCGVIEVKGDPMMYAPEDGYKSEIRHSFTAKPGEYIDDNGNLVHDEPFVFHFYFRCSDGTHAAVVAEISPVQTSHSTIDGKIKRYDGSVQLSIKKNPSGSRSLEYVESQSIQDGKAGH